MNGTTVVDIEQLLKPVPGDDPAGQELTLSAEYDQIKKAREQDDLSLPLGIWTVERKIADWPKVKKLSLGSFAKTKDVRLACWLTEALAHLHGFAGVYNGLQLLEGLFRSFWDSLYPKMDGEEKEERAGRVEWLNTNLALAIGDIPITDSAAGGYALRHLKEALELENIGRADPLALQNILGDERNTRIAPEKFRKSVADSPGEFYRGVHQDLLNCREGLARLTAIVDERFAPQSPSLLEIGRALEECYEFVHATATEKGIFVQRSEDGVTTPNRPGDTSGETSSEGAVRGRADALRRLGEIARFFKQTEPHSPVAYLIERAIHWGKMPLERWLEDVIKDEGVLGAVRETLGIKTAREE